ncbi:hypothetical protein tinsulaeT_02740 [Thalassotalea insulae]|uniref:DnrP protein n=1 Tax=Thalassotalea insulae TaxID=2056778 RepID=A0ABQ6GMW1_9GAMM|nr:DnrP protein [Thalassotalea insulae]GLX76934.1 hypothetical protein tinsulaeT_02740 [Thalassotalea insulae]
MSPDNVPCLYCQTPNDSQNTHCQNCGMAMPKKHPESAKVKQKLFKYFFWAIALFCLIMMFYLPRSN